METVKASLGHHPGPRGEVDGVNQGEAAAPADCVKNGDGGRGRDDWCDGRETSTGRRCHRSLAGSTGDLVNREYQAKKCCLAEGPFTARDEEGMYACRCVLTYEGEITGLTGQVNSIEVCFP